MRTLFKLKPVRPSRLESPVLREVRNLLMQFGIWHMRMNTGATRVGSRFIRFGCPGCADLLASVKGQFVWIETKGTNGRQSSDQKLFQDIVQREHHSYVLARSAADVFTWLREHGMVGSQNSS